MDDRFWAREFGWPPDVVDRQSPARLRRLAAVHGAALEGEHHRQEQDTEQANARMRAQMT